MGVTGRDLIASALTSPRQADVGSTTAILAMPVGIAVAVG